MIVGLQEGPGYESVAGIGEYEFEGLTVIAGVNGAGKAHLLQAIKEGAIRACVDGQLVDTSDMALYDWTDSEVDRTTDASASQIRQAVENAWRQISAIKRQGPVVELVGEHRAQIEIAASDRHTTIPPFYKGIACPGRDSNPQAPKGDSGF